MESEFVDWLRARVPPNPSVPLGIGDDATVVQLGSARCVACTDMLMDGVDFILGDCDPRLVGRKALAVNLSDMAAMAASPVAALVSIAANRDTSSNVLKQVYEGLLELADAFGVALAGGDTNTWSHPLAISVTVFGEPAADAVVTRRGAQPGDSIIVTGSFGGSILGRHFTFEPRVREAIELHRQYAIHAAIDVSDGLSLDVHRMAVASNCGAMLDLDSIPISEAARELAAKSADAATSLDHALSDGEDFELVLAVPCAEAGRLLQDQPLRVPLAKVGDFVVEPGLWSGTSAKTRAPLDPRGYQH